MLNFQDEQQLIDYCHNVLKYRERRHIEDTFIPLFVTRTIFDILRIQIDRPIKGIISERFIFNYNENYSKPIIYYGDTFIAKLITK